MTLLKLLPILLALAATPEPPGGDVPAQRTVRLELEALDGRQFDAILHSIDADGHLHYKQDGQPGQVELSDLVRASVITEGDPFCDEPSPRDCTLYLAGGSVLDARLLPSDSDTRRIRADIGLSDAISIPLTAIRGIRLARTPNDAAEAELVARMEDHAAGRDFLIAVREGRTVVLPGALERLTPEEWSFRVGQKLQTATLDKAYAIVLGGLAGEKAAPVTVRLAAGRMLAGRIVTASPAELLLDVGALGRLRLPWAKIRQVLIRSERVVHLSELEPESVEHRTLFGTSWPVRRDRNVTGGPMLLAGRRFDRGVGVHAYTAMTYDLQGRFEQFTAVIGIDDSVAPHGRAIFRVLCDGRTVFESEPIVPGQSRTVRIDLTGVSRLTLICDPGDDLDFSDHGNWCAARLLRSRNESIR